MRVGRGEVLIFLSFVFFVVTLFLLFVEFRVHSWLLLRKNHSPLKTKHAVYNASAGIRTVAERVCDVLRGEDARAEYKRICDARKRGKVGAPYSGYFRDGTNYVTFDNTSGDFFVEVFASVCFAAMWAAGEDVDADDCDRRYALPSFDHDDRKWQPLHEIEARDRFEHGEALWHLDADERFRQVIPQSDWNATLYEISKRNRGVVDFAIPAEARTMEVAS